uniref:Maturation protein n=1 Tax=Beihai levi-like virus 33 TaxID=1922419 RepID=A0A1L3KII4_9VIRU|nr:hypothetical protein [Beihai levi-like virus 33]
MRDRTRRTGPTADSLPVYTVDTPIEIREDFQIVFDWLVPKDGTGKWVLLHLKTGTVLERGTCSHEDGFMTWYQYRWYWKSTAEYHSYVDAVIDRNKSSMKKFAKVDTTNTRLAYSRTSYEDKVMTDKVVPGFRTKSKKGAVFVNPMASTEVQGEFSPPTSAGGLVEKELRKSGTSGSTADKRSQNIYLTLESSSGFAPFESVLTDRLVKLVTDVEYLDPRNAINDAYGNIDEGDLEALVMTGEARQTLSHLAETVTRLIKLFKNIRSGNWKTLAPKTLKRFRQAKSLRPSTKQIDFLQDAWMEARYAWRPLVYDVNGIIKYARGDHALSKRQTFRGFTGDSGSTDDKFEVTIGGDNCVVEYTLQTKRSVRAGVLCEARSDLTSTNHLGLMNVAKAGWDLVPYSFILDWFINISGTLYYLNPNATYKVLGAWDTRINDNVVFGKLTRNLSDGSQEVYPFRVTAKRKLRTPGATPTLFSLRLNIDFMKLLDLAAVLRNLKR